jgi:hypothetical protein
LEFGSIFLVDKKSQHQQAVILFLDELIFNFFELEIWIALELKLLAGVPEHILHHLTKPTHKLQMALGELLFLLLVLSSQVSCVALLLLLQLHKYLRLANKFIELYRPVFLQLTYYFFLVQQTLNSLKNLPNVSDLVFDSLCVVYHVRGQQFVYFKFLVNELLKVFSVP